MVNQTSCTKSMFGFVHIHIVHSYPQSFPPELSTSDFVGFSGFSSYTPTYPHYPHIFTCSFLHLLYICPFFLFCIYLINLLFLTKIYAVPIDIFKCPLLIIQYSFAQYRFAGHIFSYFSYSFATDKRITIIDKQ